MVLNWGVHEGCGVVRDSDRETRRDLEFPLCELSQYRNDGHYEKNAPYCIMPP